MIRFVEEINSVIWGHEQLLFLDQVSFDNRGMWRKWGYALAGESIVYRGEFKRFPRVSLLCFAGVNGLLECYHTEGTFTRLKFFENCKDFAFSGKVNQYPGFNYIWILDGARIHCDRNLVDYFRTLGIIIIFLPVYCPFFNPSEYLFSVVKKWFQREYVEGQAGDKILFQVSATLSKFQRFSLKDTFIHCGYKLTGTFDPKISFSINLADLDFQCISSK